MRLGLLAGIFITFGLFVLYAGAAYTLERDLKARGLALPVVPKGHKDTLCLYAPLAVFDQVLSYYKPEYDRLNDRLARLSLFLSLDEWAKAMELIRGACSDRQINGHFNVIWRRSVEAIKKKLVLDTREGNVPLGYLEELVKQKPSFYLVIYNLLIYRLKDTATMQDVFDFFHSSAMDYRHNYQQIGRTVDAIFQLNTRYLIVVPARRTIKRGGFHRIFVQVSCSAASRGILCYFPPPFTKTEVLSRTTEAVLGIVFAYLNPSELFSIPILSTHYHQRCRKQQSKNVYYKEYIRRSQLQYHGGVKLIPTVVTEGLFARGLSFYPEFLGRLNRSFILLISHILDGYPYSLKNKSFMGRYRWDHVEKFTVYAIIYRFIQENNLMNASLFDLGEKLGQFYRQFFDVLCAWVFSTLKSKRKRLVLGSPCHAPRQGQALGATWPSPMTIRHPKFSALNDYPVLIRWIGTIMQNGDACLGQVSNFVFDAKLFYLVHIIRSCRLASLRYVRLDMHTLLGRSAAEKPTPDEEIRDNLCFFFESTELCRLYSVTEADRFFDAFEAMCSDLVKFLEELILSAVRSRD